MDDRGKHPGGPPSGKKVAVVGAGPAGFSCAEQLVQKGHQVTIFECQAGARAGCCCTASPISSCPRRWSSPAGKTWNRLGCEFLGQHLYRKRQERSTNLLAEGYEAVFVGVGTGIDSPMEAPGEDLPGVYKATEFLIRANVDPKLPAGRNERDPRRIGSKVAVIGGGDTASDCLRTALRMGAEEVTCLYRRTENEMPGGRKDRQLAREEGAQYQFLTQPVRFLAGEDGRLAQIECIRMELGEPDAKGRRKPVPIDGSNFMVEADTAILALGYWPDPVIGEIDPWSGNAELGPDCESIQTPGPPPVPACTPAAMG